MQKTIASGAALTSAISLDRNTILSIAIPATWTAADLTFQGSMDNDTFFEMRNQEGTRFQVAVVAGDWVAFHPDDFRSPLFVKIRSGTAAVPVNQAADRVLEISIGRPA